MTVVVGSIVKATKGCGPRHPRGLQNESENQDGTVHLDGDSPHDRQLLLQAGRGRKGDDHRYLLVTVSRPSQITRLAFVISNPGSRLPYLSHHANSQHSSPVYSAMDTSLVLLGAVAHDHYVALASRICDAATPPHKPPRSPFSGLRRRSSRRIWYP